MLRSILIGLDGSDASKPALELGLRWARRFDAVAVGIGVLDEPGIRLSATLPAAGAHHWPVTTPPTTMVPLREARHQVEAILQEFAHRCGESGVACRTVEGVGTPYVEIIKEAERHDLILLGRRSHFEFGDPTGPGETLARVVQEGTRPVVAVPGTLPEDGPVVVAYDGSAEASRSLYAFEASGLWRGRQVRVISVDPDREGAAGHAAAAVAFLRAHEIDAHPHPVESTIPPAELIRMDLHRVGAGLLVMGAYGRSPLREFFFGSVTRTMLEEGPVPVFLCH